MSENAPAPERTPPGEKVKQFPPTPGVYLMKDDAGPRHLRRQGEEPAQPGVALLHQGGGRGCAHGRSGQADRRHRLHPGRHRGRRPADGSPPRQGHSAALQRRPQGRQDLSLSANPHARGVSARRVHAHARAAAASSSMARSPAPRVCGRRSRCCSASSSFAPARSTSSQDDPHGAGFGPASCTASTSARPRATSASAGKITASRFARLRMVLEGQKDKLLEEWNSDMTRGQREAASSRRRPGSATRSRPCKSLGLRGDVDKDVQPEVFHIEPRKGLIGLAQDPRAERDAADHRRGRHRPSGRRGNGGVAGVVHRRLAVQARLSALQDQVGRGGRRFRLDPRSDLAPLSQCGRRQEEQVFPDILLIDGGKGQLNAALDVFRMLGKEPPCLISLAKREEEIYRPGEASRCA